MATTKLWEVTMTTPECTEENFPHFFTTDRIHVYTKIEQDAKIKALQEYKKQRGYMPLDVRVSCEIKIDNIIL